MAVALHRHELVDVLGPEAHHPPHVVAGQVHEHDVLGHLFGVLGQLSGQAVVLGLGRAPAARPGDRSRHHHPVAQPHQGLGGGARPRCTARVRRKYRYGLGFTSRSTR